MSKSVSRQWPSAAERCGHLSSSAADSAMSANSFAGGLHTSARSAAAAAKLLSTRSIPSEYMRVRPALGPRRRASYMAVGFEASRRGRGSRGRLTRVRPSQVLERHLSLLRSERCRLYRPRLPIAYVHPGEGQTAPAGTGYDAGCAALALAALAVPESDQDLAMIDDVHPRRGVGLRPALRCRQLDHL